ncbi:MAG: hypothetical protein NTY08_08145 [Proteobacteria bacterium]|nr:hypothetical protein [Pseudomonadota bacterium]
MPMYSADKDKFVSSLVISSQAAALRDVDRWLSENQYDSAYDGDGWLWNQSVEVTQIPDPGDTRRIEWQLRIQLQTQMSAQDLVTQDVLSPDQDARLLSIIGESLVPMAMKPSKYRAATESAARSLVAELLPKVKETFKEYQLKNVKRALVHRWVDENCSFDRLRPKIG